MSCFWSILMCLALLTAGSLPDSAEASDQRSLAWKKSTNFNNHPPRKAVINIMKRRPKVEIAQSHRAGKKIEVPTFRILATFQFDDAALAHAPSENPTALARPAPGKCEWVQSIVAGYAFENVTPRTCTGSVFTYEARRADRTYLIQASALNGELIKVERTSERMQSADIPDGASPRTIEPAIDLDFSRLIIACLILTLVCSAGMVKPTRVRPLRRA
jgi:hypothetical protein